MEVRETLRAIQEGEVDALLIRKGDAPQVYSLHSAERPYRLMMEKMHEGAVSLSADGTILYCNRRFAELVGRPLEKVMGQQLQAFFGGRETWERLVDGGELELEHELLARGRAVSVKTSIARLEDEGEVTYCGVITDLTRQKAHERLRESERKLREADRHKDEFLAMLGHELRNPLAPLAHAVEILRTEMAIDERREWAVGVMGRQLQHIQRIVDDLLDTDRINRGLVELAREPVQLSAVLEAAVETIKPFLIERGHRLRVRVEEDVLVVGDRTRLVQVVGNLLHNAAKYTPDGGDVELRLRRIESEARITVRDNGIGIEPDLLPRVFDLFTQAKQRLDRSSGGLGMGLALVRKLIELQGGSVNARSGGAGAGSEFEVRLPLAPVEDQPTTALPAPVVGANEPTLRRVLVVDDNVDAADSLALLLEGEGFEVRVVYDGHAALAAVDDLVPEVICLDLGLPEIDGLEVAKRLRGKFGRDLRLVALTGYGQERDRNSTREVGFDHHLVKPVDIKQLLSLLR